MMGLKRNEESKN
jgi:hypothetical protein